MKKLVYLFAAGAFLASCNRDVSSLQDPTAESRIDVLSGSALSNQLRSMNESFTISGKAAQNLSYLYTNFAEAPANLAYTEELAGGIVTGTSDLAQATSVTANGEMVFVTWHLEDARYGGSISAYKLVNGTYQYTSRIDFDDTDWHEAEVHRNTGTGNYEIFAVGQRSPSTSGYLLNGHRGAVVGKILYNYITDEFQGHGTYKELPLPGYGANAIITSAGKYYILTGNGQGTVTNDARSGLYVTDYNLTNVSESMTITDGIFVEADPFNSSPSNVDYALLDRTANDKVQVRRGMNTTQTVSNAMSYTIDYITGGGIPSLALERGGMAFIPYTYSGSNVSSTEYLLALGQEGLYGQFTGHINNAVNYCLAVTHDPSARVIYAAAGDAGLKVVAGHGFNGGVLINPFDLVGQFVPPTNAFIAGFNVKDVSVYFSDYLAVAVGGTDGSGVNPRKGGVYFVRKLN
ncbi:hypothetical protein [Croceimicrobium sp.]|uniref:hypothetical protein n=1 Tax=Croceimicrobium sp. TaxID=2828340 RepID=UPI003BAB9C94